MPNGTAPEDKPRQSKPIWEYLVGGALWGIGFFGAAYMLKRASGGSLLDGDEDEDES